MTVVLISCTKEKLDREAPARELYQGRLFLASVRYAEAIGARWFVLSAAHGLVDPDQPIAPYDQTLVGANKPDLMTWAAMVSDQLGERLPDVKRFTVLAGAEYVKGLQRFPAGRTFETPLAGLGVGERYARLVEMTKAVETESAATSALDEAREFMRQALGDGHHGEARLSGAHLRSVFAAIGGAA